MSDFEAYFEIDADTYVGITPDEFSIVIFSLPVVQIPLGEIAPQLERIIEAVREARG